MNIDTIPVWLGKCTSVLRPIDWFENEWELGGWMFFHKDHPGEICLAIAGAQVMEDGICWFTCHLRVRNDEFNTVITGHHVRTMGADNLRSRDSYDKWVDGQAQDTPVHELIDDEDFEEWMEVCKQKQLVGHPFGRLLEKYIPKCTTPYVANNIAQSRELIICTRSYLQPFFDMTPLFRFPPSSSMFDLCNWDAWNGHVQEHVAANIIKRSWRDYRRRVYLRHVLHAWSERCVRPNGTTYLRVISQYQTLSQEPL